MHVIEAELQETAAHIARNRAANRSCRIASGSISACFARGHLKEAMHAMAILASLESQDVLDCWKENKCWCSVRPRTPAQDEDFEVVSGSNEVASAAEGMAAQPRNNLRICQLIREHLAAPAPAGF